MTAAMAPIYNTFARVSNASVVNILGKRLMPLHDAQGQAPAPGDFPQSTNELYEWAQLGRRNTIVWARVHRLLQHYAVLDPATGLPFVAAGAKLPQQPAGQTGITRLRAHVEALREHITL